MSERVNISLQHSLTGEDALRCVKNLTKNLFEEISDRSMGSQFEWNGNKGTASCYFLGCRIHEEITLHPKHFSSQLEVWFPSFIEALPNFIKGRLTISIMNKLVQMRTTRLKQEFARYA